MADLPLYENSHDLPHPRTRAEMRFDEVSVEPYGDGRRLKLTLKFPPFLERPSVEAWVTDPHGKAVAAMSLIEAMDQEFDFTLHLRGPEPHGEYMLHARLFYVASDERPDEKQIVDERVVTFTIN